jgi:chemotaxis protein CheD
MIGPRTPEPPPADAVHSVAMGELAVLRARHGRLVTYALGSCVGLALHDAVAGIGGMAHVQLPSSRLAGDQAAAQARPGRYADLGLPLLFAELVARGALARRMRVTIAGGANTTLGTDVFAIGERNLTAVRKWLWQTGLLVAGEATGGGMPRTMTLDLATGGTWISSQGKVTPL